MSAQCAVLRRERDEALRVGGEQTAELDRVRFKLEGVVELLARFEAEGDEALNAVGEALELARATLHPPPVDPYTRIPLELGSAMGMLMSCAAQLRALDRLQASERATEMAIAVYGFAQAVLPRLAPESGSAR